MRDEVKAQLGSHANERQFEAAAHALSGFAASELERLALLLHGIEILITARRDPDHAAILEAHISTARELAEKAAADVRQIAGTVGISHD